VAFLSPTALLSSAYGDTMAKAKTAVRMRAFDTAFRLYLQEAKAGNADAQYQVAKLYAAGLGVDRSDRAARRWYEQAAEQQHAAAQYNLALLVAPSESARAQQLFQASAESGYGPALSHLHQQELKRDQPSAASSVTSIEITELAKVFSAVKKNDVRQLKALKDAGVSVHQRDQYGRTALYFAVQANAREAMVWLLSQGLDPALPDQFGISPLALAVDTDQAPLFEYLLTRSKGVYPVLANGDSLLHQAVRKNNKAIIQLLLQQPMNINALNKDGWTALDIALHLGHQQTAALLRKKKATVGAGWQHAPTADVRQVAMQLKRTAAQGQFTPAEAAILNSNLPLLLRLINTMGNDALNQVQPSGQTLLGLAVQQGNDKIVAALIAQGASPNIAGAFGVTPVMIAVKQDKPALLKKLIAAGGDVLAKDAKKRDAIDHAILTDNTPIMTYLINDLDRPLPTQALADYLLLATKYGRVDAIKLIVRGRKALERRDGNQRNAIWYACQSGLADIIPDLIHAGVNPHTIDSSGQSSLTVAASSGCLTCAQKLSRYNTVDHQTKAGATALMIAAQKDNSQFVQWLLQQQADIELHDRSGNTALMHAVQARAKKPVEQLAQAGANVSRKNHLGLSALDMAKESTPELYEILKKKKISPFF
ncbi:MAG: ankyrin repeat domain-containing protein, partial [Gammaproteobacteria bacterium]